MESENELDDNFENKQPVCYESSPSNNSYCNKEVTDSSISQQHRKTVELIECGENDGNVAERKNKPSLSNSSAHNGRNKRRRRLRKT